MAAPTYRSSPTVRRPAAARPAAAHPAAVRPAAARLGGREMEAFIQPANVAFFRWLGWRPAGSLVDYAGIPHQRMLIDLTQL